MTNDERTNLRNRRLLRPVTVSKTAQLFSLPVSYATNGFRALLLDWIAQHTTGEFYVSSSVLYFCNEQDAMAYTLYNAREKCEIFIKLKKERAAQ